MVQGVRTSSTSCLETEVRLLLCLSQGYHRRESFMSKIKMRCTTCGKWFQSANAKEVTCPDCVQKARKEKLAAKTTPPPTNRTPGTGIPSRPAAPPPPKPTSGGTSHWFDRVEDVKVGQPDQPPRPKLPPSPATRDTRDTRDTRGGQEPF